MKKKAGEARRRRKPKPAGGHSAENIAGEKCQRCGEAGEDRRTLLMSCFYAMEELGVPFKQLLVKGDTFHYDGTKEVRLSDDPRFPTFKSPKYATEPSASLESVFYTLRVCKKCRSEWMAKISEWFNEKPAEDASCGTGIFVRELGSIREVTLEQFEEIKKARKSGSTPG